MSRPIIFRIFSILLCFQTLILGNISRISLSTHPREKASGNNRKNFCSCQGHPSKLALGIFFFFFIFADAKGEMETCGSVRMTRVGEQTLYKELKIQTGDQDLSLIQDEDSCRQTRVTNAAGRRGGSHIPRCPPWVRHTPFLRRVQARHRAGYHTRSSAAAQG